jgi:hypothetical protein
MADLGACLFILAFQDLKEDREGLQWINNCQNVVKVPMKRIDSWLIKFLPGPSYH